MPAAGGAALDPLGAHGSSTVALPATGTGELAELLGAGAGTVGLVAQGAALLPLLGASGGASVFRPEDVPAVAAGYYWDPAQATNSGLATFSMPEAQGKTAYNQITPSLAAAPTIGTINGQAVVQHINRTAPSIDSLSRTSTQLTRGWTGATMLCGWFQVPTGGAGLVFNHWRSNINLGLALGAVRADCTGHDGTAGREAQHPMPAGWATTPVYIEYLFDPLQVATNRLQFWVNRGQITPSVAPSMGSILRDSASYIAFSGQVSDGSGFNLSADFAHGVVCLCNGIPSTVERDALRNHRRLAA